MDSTQTTPVAQKRPASPCKEEDAPKAKKPAKPRAIWLVYPEGDDLNCMWLMEATINYGARSPEQAGNVAMFSAENAAKAYAKELNSALPAPAKTEEGDAEP